MCIMGLIKSLYLVLLFVLLTPGVLVTAVKGGSRVTNAVVHGLLFVVVLYLTIGFVQRIAYSYETFGAYEYFQMPENNAAAMPNMKKEGMGGKMQS